MSISGGERIANYQRPVDLLEIAQRGNKTSSKATESGESSFKEMFSRELTGRREVTFSKHASQRLYSRGIELSEADIDKIADAIDKAQGKGSRESLVLADDYALVVSVKDRTVVTAFDREHLSDGVVTQIDSAVIL